MDNTRSTVLSFLWALLAAMVVAALCSLAVPLPFEKMDWQIFIPVMASILVRRMTAQHLAAANNANRQATQPPFWQVMVGCTVVGIGIALSFNLMDVVLGKK